MNESENEDQKLSTPEVLGWEEAASAGKSRGNLWSLVLSARGIPHKLRRFGDFTSIYVLPPYSESAKREIELFEEENLQWPPREEALPRPAGGGVLLSGALMASLAFFHDLTTRPHFSIAKEIGKASSAKMLWYGQWWRAVTALTLHGDSSHLLANLVAGFFFLAWFMREAGWGAGLLFMIVAGAAGNAANAWYSGVPHSSVGLSTALFALIGGLSAFGVVARGGVPWRKWLIPIGGGVALLSLMGGPGEMVDFPAHIFGFICGFALGLPVARFLAGKPARNLPLQTLFFFSAVGVVALCWFLAFRAG